MNAAYSWLRRFSRWAAEPSTSWLAIGVVVLALCVALRPGTSEPVIRYVGLVLQLLGVCTVAWGIAETRRLFGEPTFVAAAREWFKRVPPFKLRPITASANIVLDDDKLHATAYVTDNVPSGAPIELRVEVLEKNLARVN